MFPSGYHDNEGKEYKDLLVNKIYERYYKDNLDLLTFSAIGHHFLSSVIYQYFNWYGKTRNHCHEGHFNYLLPSEIQQPPELP
jgi:Rieske Fe-S protein